MATSYVVLAGVVSIVNGDAKYKGEIVDAGELGDQLERHLKNEAIRGATAEEIEAGRASGEVAEASLEEQLEQVNAQGTALNERRKQLEQQIKDRDARIKAEADAKAAADKANPKK